MRRLGLGALDVVNIDPATTSIVENSTPPKSITGQTSSDKMFTAGRARLPVSSLLLSYTP